MGRRGNKATGGSGSGKRKPVKVTPIERGPDGGPEPYAIMDRLIAEARPDLTAITISMAWRRGWTIDKDDKLKAGKCCKPNEVGRQFMDCDIVILLNEELWGELSASQREELVFHEMEHIVIVVDENLDPKLDEKGRPVVRIRKHDIEEFRSVRERYGRENLSGIEAANILARAKEPLLQSHAGKRPKAEPVGARG